MAYEVEVTDAFKGWYEDTLNASEQLSVERVVTLLMEAGPALGHPVKLRHRGVEVLAYA